MKKGQIEVMGLVIIVIIIVISFVVFLRFYLISKASESGSVDLVLSQKANNFANALLGLEVCNSNMKEAIISCCNGESFCGREACDFSLDVISNVVNLTVLEGVSFEAKDYSGKTCISYLSKGKCPFLVMASPSYVKSTSGEAEVNVGICRK